jgi:hydrogenase 3 maturation protease
MPNLEKFLKNRLKDADRVALLAIGSEFRGDDAAGLLVANNITKSIKRTNKRFKIFIGATAPENLTGDIKRFDPSHILLIDSVDFHDKPGSIVVLSPRDIGDGVSFSTHKMPARVLMQYFTKSFECDPVLIGIQPLTVDFGKNPSRVVVSAAREIAGAIVNAIKTLPLKRA